MGKQWRKRRSSQKPYEASLPPAPGKIGPQLRYYATSALARNAEKQAWLRYRETLRTQEETIEESDQGDPVGTGCLSGHMTHEPKTGDRAAIATRPMETWHRSEERSSAREGS